MPEALKKINWTAVGVLVTLVIGAVNALWMLSAVAARTEDGVAAMKTQIVGHETAIKDHAIRVGVIENHIFYIRESLQRIERALTERK